MEAALIDWLNLLLRWLHVIFGIAWIGASFYFVWLDNSLEEPPRWKKEKGIRGDLWSIHGGGFYEVAKYRMAPEKMPDHLHWFKWEAYATWISGFCLLSLMYYFNASVYLIDPRVMQLSPAAAVVIGIGSLIGGWLVYDLLCKSPLGRNGWALGITLIVFLTAMSYFYTHIFSGRGAYIHVGALIGTIMAGNVFRVIMPSQRALVSAVEKGGEPDPSWGAKAKLRSTHNNYFTLPLIFIMLSNHYPATYQSKYAWVILPLIGAIAAFARHYFNLKHRGIKRPAILVTAGVAFAALALVVSLPKTTTFSLGFSPAADAKTTDAPAATEAPAEHKAAASLLTNKQAVDLVQNRCAVCHSAHPKSAMFTAAPMGVEFDTLAEIKQWKPRILARAVDSNDMPFMNKTHMTDKERQELGQWLHQLK